jgi:hypothetical protein
MSRQDAIKIGLLVSAVVVAVLADLSTVSWIGDKGAKWVAIGVIVARQVMNVLQKEATPMPAPSPVGAPTQPLPPGAP